VQALHLSNGDAINDKLAGKESRITKLLEANPSSEKLIQDAWMLCFSRPPTPTEQTQFLPLLNDAPGDEKRKVAEDMFWSLLTSREFIFQH
jgi:hypothetical protein